jgi:hypothetical protein
VSEGGGGVGAPSLLLHLPVSPPPRPSSSSTPSPPLLPLLYFKSRVATPNQIEEEFYRFYTYIGFSFNLENFFLYFSIHILWRIQRGTARLQQDLDTCGTRGNGTGTYCIYLAKKTHYVIQHDTNSGGIA